MKKEEIEMFEKLHIQIKDMYSELSVLSKKNPNTPINEFKLKFVNQLLSQSNVLLGEKYKPFTEFSVFSSDDLPFISDIVLILSQYIKCLEKLKYDNVKVLSGTWYWIISGSKEQIATSHPLFDLTM